MDKVIDNIKAIEEWIDSVRDIEVLPSNDAFMRLTVDLMNKSLYVLRVGISIAPSDEVSHRGYSKHRAIIVGHMVRTAKLYEGLLIHISQRQLRAECDLCSTHI